MEAQIIKIKRQRRFSTSFKRRLVKEFEQGLYSVSELGKLHQIHIGIIYRWIYKYSSNQELNKQIIDVKESSDHKVKDLEKRIKELERMVGNKQIEIEYLNKMMEIAKDQLGIDIKKNFNTPPSSGSGKTRKK